MLRGFQYCAKFAVAVAMALLVTGPANAATETPAWTHAPKIESLLKPAVYQRAVDNRDVMTHASLDGEHYSYYATMLVRASLKQTHDVLTNYALYAKMISYIDEAKYSPERQILEIAGGIWKWKLRSWVKFEEKGSNWIHYRIVGGHFTGMTGDILFEPLGAKGTLVYLGGGLTESSWPPRFIIETGAEIVFGFTGKRMRSYIESTKLEESPENRKNSPKNYDQNVPQPRSRL